jgi:dTDP-4-amino-4,6-dideoxygalactose transaminase
MKKINVTKPYLPNKKSFYKYIDQIYESSFLTNNGPFVQELERKLEKYLGVKNIVLTANGTLALQIAFKLLELKGNVITTPFSFIATTSSLVWENLKPVFVDINPKTFNINPELIESKINSRTSAILPVHVFGNSCEIEKIQEIATKNNLKVIYDAAHAFGVKYNGKSIFHYGDISIASFHATKIFHTIEGGALIIKNNALYKKAKRIINFGYREGEIHDLGINAKMNEFSAAMGLSLLKNFGEIMKKRKKVWYYYYKNLENNFKYQKREKGASNNYHYFPILLKNENQVLKIEKALQKEEITPRRYFYPSLDTLDYIKPKQKCKISRDIASRILCLPIYPDLSKRDQDRIIKIIKENL